MGRSSQVSSRSRREGGIHKCKGGASRVDSIGMTPERLCFIRSQKPTNDCRSCRGISCPCREESGRANPVRFRCDARERCGPARAGRCATMAGAGRQGTDDDHSPNEDSLAELSPGRRDRNVERTPVTCHRRCPSVPARLPEARRKQSAVPRGRLAAAGAGAERRRGPSARCRHEAEPEKSVRPVWHNSRKPRTMPVSARSGSSVG